MTAKSVLRKLLGHTCSKVSETHEWDFGKEIGYLVCAHCHRRRIIGGNKKSFEKWSDTRMDAIRTLTAKKYI